MSVVFGLSIQTFDANSCTVWIENVLLKFSLGGEVEGVEGNSNKKRSASNCKEDENMFLSPCKK